MAGQKENLDFLKELLKQKDTYIEITSQQVEKLREERESLIRVITELQKIDEAGG